MVSRNSFFARIPFLGLAPIQVWPLARLPEAPSTSLARAYWIEVRAGTSPVFVLLNGSRCRKWAFSRIWLLCLYTSMTGQSAYGPLTKIRRRLVDPEVTPARNSADSLGDLTMSFHSCVAYRKIFLYSSHLMQPVAVVMPRRFSLPMEPYPQHGSKWPPTVLNLLSGIH